jgi:hypothetical protein
VRLRAKEKKSKEKKRALTPFQGSDPFSWEPRGARFATPVERVWMGK